MKKTMLTAPFESPVIAALCSDAQVSGRRTAALSEAAALSLSAARAEAEAEARRKKPPRAKAPKEDPAKEGSLKDSASRDDASSTDEAGPENELLASSKPQTVIIPWDPMSFVSARVALQETINALGQFDEAVVVVDPGNGRTGTAEADLRAFASFSPREMDAIITKRISSPTHLIHEILRRFDERGTGTLVIGIAAAAPASPLDSLVAGAMESLASSLAGERAPTGERDMTGCRVIAVRDETGLAEPFAQYLLRVLEDPPRQPEKLLRHTGRAGLFGKL